MSSNPDVPPFTGYVETTVNALRLIHAARQGVIPRITRRLNDSERRTMIKSGAVFVLLRKTDCFGHRRALLETFWHVALAYI